MADVETRGGSPASMPMALVGVAYYWNKPNFEGLIQIAEALEAEPKLQALAEYCRLRERGMRRQAFSALERFFDEANSWEVEDKREICQGVLEIHARTPEAHQFLSQPMLSRLILPVLEEWVEAEPTGVIPLRWLGILTQAPALLKRALAESPEDVPARRSLAGLLLSGVDYATHHLVEGRILGDLEETQAAVARIRALLEAAPEPAAFADLVSELEHYEMLLADWALYEASPEGTFPEWCERRGRSYQWPTVYYYGEDDA